jgi:hypothetical protein
MFARLMVLSLLLTGCFTSIASPPPTVPIADKQTVIQHINQSTVAIVVETKDGWRPPVLVSGLVLGRLLLPLIV